MRTRISSAEFSAMDASARADWLLDALARTPPKERAPQFLAAKLDEWCPEPIAIGSDVIGQGMGRFLLYRRRRKLKNALDCAYASLLNQGLVEPDNPQGSEPFCRLSEAGEARRTELRSG